MSNERRGWRDSTILLAAVSLLLSVFQNFFGLLTFSFMVFAVYIPTLLSFLFYIATAIRSGRNVDSAGQ